MVASHTNDNDDGDVMIFSIGIDTFSNEWNLNSSFSYYVCSKQDWFDSFEAKEKCTIWLGNNSACEIVGVGIVKIKMFNAAMYTLGGVQYVPKMHKNMISPNVLDSNGFGYSARDGVMEIARGIKVVIMAEKCDNLYWVVRNIVVYGVLVVSTTWWRRYIWEGPMAGKHYTRVTFPMAACARIPKSLQKGIAEKLEEQIQVWLE